MGTQTQTPYRMQTLSNDANEVFGSTWVPIGLILLLFGFCGLFFTAFRDIGNSTEDLLTDIRDVLIFGFMIVSGLVSILIGQINEFINSKKD